MFLGLLDPVPYCICTDPAQDKDPDSDSDPDPYINKQKNEEKLYFQCFVTSLWLFIVEEWCIFKKEAKNEKKKNIFC